jgi:hypothetical protein
MKHGPKDRTRSARALLAATLLCAAACGGGGGGGGGGAAAPPAAVPSTPASSPAASPSPQSPLTAAPQSVSLNGIGATHAATLTIAEAGYSGSFSESDTCAGIAVLATQSAHGPSATFLVTGVSAAVCAATFANAASQTIVVPVTVTQTGIVIDSR